MRKIIFCLSVLFIALGTQATYAACTSYSGLSALGISSSSVSGYPFHGNVEAVNPYPPTPTLRDTGGGGGVSGTYSETVYFSKFSANGTDTTCILAYLTSSTEDSDLLRLLSIAMALNYDVSGTFLPGSAGPQRVIAPAIDPSTVTVTKP